MGQTFPTSVPSYPDTTNGDVLGNAGNGHGLSRILDDYGLDITGVATKLGTGNTTSSSNSFLVGTGSGASAWQSAATARTSMGLGSVATLNTVSLTTDVTGTLPLANGGTGVTSAAALAAAVGTLLYPVGAIYIATVSTNPGTLLGFGTWVAFGAGKTLVSLNGSDADFDTVEETGGSKTNTHNHWQTSSFDGGGAYITVTGQSPRSRVVTQNRLNFGGTVATGGTREDSTYDETISIMPPYVVVYMWKRTA